MLPLHDWLSDRNLKNPSVIDGPRLEGEALMYALVTYFVRPGRLPDDVVVVLAEDHFARLAPVVGD